jgi:reductive dehalogenase
VTAVSPDIITKRIKGLALYLGATEVGVTKIKPHHIYSNVGRGEGGYGTEIILPHEYAIVFTVSMNYAMISNAPRIAVTIESSRFYAEAAKIGLVVAEYLRYLGYEARTHMDGNYRLILPAVAVDAGLGELGRLNLLITRTDGPRVRLGAISTNCTLVADQPIAFGVQDFCTRCKKCAENCPSNAIPKGEKKAIRGVQKWGSNQEACFRQWLEFGTDCALCIRVCPYSKPDTFSHKIVRFAAENSCVSRQLATWSDDLFYGKYPSAVSVPEWLK